MSVPFRERNPVTIGAISLAVIAALLVVAFKAGDLPVIGGGDTYYASFSEAGGLKPNDEVRIAGVRVGKVRSVELKGSRVRVKFQVDNSAQFGKETGAEIKVKTILGSMFLALKPAGPGQLAEGTDIPVSRTSSPYDVVEVFEGLAERSERIDTKQLATAFDTLAAVTRNTPEEFKSALKGVSALSQTVASRDDQLNELLRNLDDVSQVLGDRKDDIVALMKDGDVLFRALVARRQAVSNLLKATANLSQELTTLVRQSRADLKPALDQLQGVVDLLNANQENLDSSLRLLAPFYRVFANTLGNGPWFDTIIKNLPPAPGTGAGG
ncbi:MCE family protein [Nocardioides marmoribigeumensis]|uniref:Phospholipid/cholesterol/gamma-HCH transport system substrate-binding protein n=1 Tax=Nocardioides marmoribigeumensis TaxID=433649 RepID=A0ABU2BWA8_9ACTN|nr:MCE family protein [Nocardioides marmoribigeumensis]MDR7362919.1 phospholipid/cholesterol/gamma-HCH transport system substrate-binding protein [Nocardioides marmoribigeumensis]